jgi:predicted glycoside hydrolase/deacetylase ChbG (UPF0249 family)
MLIFNADDFGLNQIDSQRILELSSLGIIKSTSIVSNTVDYKALKESRCFDISKGLHINLVEGKPLTLPYSLVDSTGQLLTKRELFKKIFFGRIDLLELEKEICAQFENILDNGVEITHIDSHQNIHLLLPILKSVIKVAAKYKINKIRGQSSVYNWFKKDIRPKLIFKSVLSTAWNLEIKKDFKHTERIVLNTPGLGFKVNNVDDAVRMWKDALSRYYHHGFIYEIPCHVYLSDFEYELYKSNEFLKVLNKLNIKIGSFYDL